MGPGLAITHFIERGRVPSIKKLARSLGHEVIGYCVIRYQIKA